MATTEWTVDLATIERLEDGEALCIGPCRLPEKAFIYVYKSGNGMTLVISEEEEAEENA